MKCMWVWFQVARCYNGSLGAYDMAWWWLVRYHTESWWFVHFFIDKSLFEVWIIEIWLHCVYAQSETCITEMGVILSLILVFWMFIKLHVKFILIWSWNDQVMS